MIYFIGYPKFPRQILRIFTLIDENNIISQQNMFVLYHSNYCSYNLDFVKSSKVF